MDANEKGKPKIAVLMTCFNRKEKTLACLQSVFSQTVLEEVDLGVFLVDDGSIDGTSEAVRTHYPDVLVVPGTGNLYWNGGMRLAQRHAMEWDPDFYWWLNDDVLLVPHALETLLGVPGEVGERSCLVIGAMKDESGALTYGGVVKRPGGIFSLEFVKIPPSDRPVKCDAANGNCLLIPREVVESIGNLSEDFTHSMGDYDYGLRAAEKGFASWMAPGYLGRCSSNTRGRAYMDESLTLATRIAAMNAPAGLPPPREWMIFVRRHYGWRWPVYWIKTMVRVRAPWLYLWLKRILAKAKG